MRTSIFASTALAALVALAAFATPGAARADQEFDVNVTGGGKVTVLAKGNWHINKDYPWKLIVGDTKLDKSKFQLNEKEASVSGAPKGAGKLKGAICSGDTCKPFEKDVTVP
jgi:hypothetical protein